MCSLGAIEGLQRPVQCRDKTVAEQVHSPTQQGQRVCVVQTECFQIVKQHLKPPEVTIGMTISLTI